MQSGCWWASTVPRLERLTVCLQNMFIFVEVLVLKEVERYDVIM